MRDATVELKLEGVASDSRWRDAEIARRLGLLASRLDALERVLSRGFWALALLTLRGGVRDAVTAVQKETLAETVRLSRTGGKEAKNGK